MGPFDALLNTIGMFQQPRGGPAGAVILNELRPWFQRLVLSALPKWLPHMAAEVPCAVVDPQTGHPCEHMSISACQVCQRPCCLSHARIDQTGDSICFHCVGLALMMARTGQWSPGAAYQAPPGAYEAWEARQRQQQAPQGPTAKDIAAARRKLGVTGDSTPAEIKAAHRRASAKWHPDRWPPEGKAEAERKFKDIQAAFALLQKIAAQEQE